MARSPDISVCAHLEADATITLDVCSGSPCLSFKGDAYPSVVVFLADGAQVAALRDAADAWLRVNSVREAA